MSFGGSLGDNFSHLGGKVKGKIETMFGRGGERSYFPGVEFDQHRCAPFEKIDYFGFVLPKSEGLNSKL
jgi:hypothetical protein